MNARRFVGYSLVFAAGALANQIYLTERLTPRLRRIRMLYGLMRLQRDIQLAQVKAHERAMRAHGLAIDHECCAVCQEHGVNV